MSKIEMSNGTREVEVSAMSDEEVVLAMQHVERGDDDLREHMHAQGHETERAYLEAYAAEHIARFGSVWVLP